MAFLTLDKKGQPTLADEVRSELVPAALIPKDQLWFDHPEMRAQVARAEEEFAEGRSTRTETPEQAQAFLDRLKADSADR